MHLVAGMQLFKVHVVVEDQGVMNTKGCRASVRVFIFSKVFVNGAKSGVSVSPSAPPLDSSFPKNHPSLPIAAFLHFPQSFIHQSPRIPHFGRQHVYLSPPPFDARL